MKEGWRTLACCPGFLSVALSHPGISGDVVVVYAFIEEPMVCRRWRKVVMLTSLRLGRARRLLGRILDGEYGYLRFPSRW